MNCKTKITDVGVPRIRLPFVNLPVVHIRERNIVATLNYSSTGDSNLFLVDVNGMYDKRYKLPEGQKFAYGFTVGSDGKLYIGTSTGSIFSFDIEREEFTELARPFNLQITGAGASSDGKIYMMNFPKAEFCEYDIKSGGHKTFRPMPDDGLGYYCNGFIELPDKRMFIMVGGARPSYFIFDSKKEKYEKVYSGDSRRDVFSYFLFFIDDDRFVLHNRRDFLIYNWKDRKFEEKLLEKYPEKIGLFGLFKINNDVFGIGDETNKLYRIKNGKAIFTGRRITFLSERNVRGNIFRYRQTGNSEVCGFGDNGLFVKFDVRTGNHSRFQLNNESGRGMHVQSLLVVPEKNFVFGSHYINMQAFKTDLKTNTSVSTINKISGYAGQINCATYLKGKIYLASYIDAVVYVYDPEKEFRYGTNPRLIGEIGDEQFRPKQITNDGRSVYVATKSVYGTLGGAIAVLNTETEEMEVHRNFVPEQNPTSMFYYAGKRCLVGATDVFGDDGSCEPLAEKAVVFVWDVKTRKTVYKVSPLEIKTLYANSISEDGKLLCMGNEPDRYFVFHVDSKKVEFKDWKHGVVRTGTFIDGDLFCGATDDKLFLLDIASNKTRIIGETEGTTQLEKITKREVIFNYKKYILRRVKIEI